MDILSFLIGLITGGKGKVDPSDATATAGDILSPKTAYIVGGKATGQIQSQAAQTITPTASDQTIAAGKYLAGVQTVEGVVCDNLTAANIKKDVTVKIGTATDDDSVGSVTGSYEGEAPTLQDKTVQPTTSQQVVSADSGYDGLNEVTVGGVVISDTLIAANVAAGVVVQIGVTGDPDSMLDITGTHQGGGGGSVLVPLSVTQNGVYTPGTGVDGYSSVDVAVSSGSDDLDKFCQGTLTALVLSSATSIRNYAAYNNTGLTSVSAAEATSVGQYAFQGCSNLASASFAKATSIGYYAFYSLVNLASVSIPMAVTLAGYCFYQCAKLLFPNNELLAKTVQDYALYNAARSTNGFAWKPNASGASAGQYAFSGAKVVEVDGDNVTSIGNYAFQNAEWLADADFGSAVITTLGQYAFQNAGKSRADLTTALVLDLHSGTFTSVQQYTFGGLKNTVVTLPTTVTSLAGNAFNGIDGCTVIITRTASVPTLSATTVFSGATNSYVALPYDNLYTALQQANWNAISSMVVGYAPAGTFTAGDSLPTTDSGSHDIYWSTDPAGEGWVTECPSGSPVLYAHLGSKTGWWINVDVTGATVTVTADGVAYAITDGRATVPQTAQSIDIGVTYPSGWDTSITLNGETVTQFPITGLAARDYTLAGRAYDPSQSGVDWATDDWSLVQLTSKNGMTARVYGSQVGATRTITLTNGNTMTIRLSNATDNMYARSDGSGTTGLCMDFVDCFPDTYYMNSNGTNTGGWNACQMRTVKMAQLFDLLPSDLAAVIDTADIPTANGGSGTISVIDSEDKLFLLAEKEVFGTMTYSVAAEADALTQWAWYAAHNTNADRVKKRSGSASNWWLRSPYSGTGTYFCRVNSSGSADGNAANNSLGVSPGFVI